MIKVLITGGSGFIGTNLISFLLERGSYKVKSVDLATPKIESHKAVWECVDIRDNGALAILFEVFSPDMVVHLAARTDLRGATLEDYDSNTLGVENLIAVIKKTPSVKRVLFASSMYVCRPGYQPADMDDYDPHTVYGESKMLTERIIKGAELSVPWVIFRPTSIWGPWFSEPYIDFFKIVLGRKYFHLGKRACSKTYGYIENSVRQIEVLLEADIDRVNGRLFYIGDWPAYNISEWAEEIASKKSIWIPKIPYFLFQLAGYFGDFLKLLKIKFPMTSFRLRNMTTDNIHDLSPIKELMPVLPFSRIEGVDKTLEWMELEGEI